MSTQAIKVTTVDYPIQMTVEFCETELSFGNIGIIQIKTAEDEAPKGLLFNSLQDKHDKIKAIQLDALDYHRVVYFEIETIRIKNPNLSAEDVMHLTTAYLTTLYNQQLFTKI